MKSLSNRTNPRSRLKRERSEPAGLPTLVSCELVAEHASPGAPWFGWQIVTSLVQPSVFESKVEPPPGSTTADAAPAAASAAAPASAATRRLPGLTCVLP